MAKNNTIAENLSEKERNQKMTKEQTVKIEKEHLYLHIRKQQRPGGAETFQSSALSGLAY